MEKERNLKYKAILSPKYKAIYFIGNPKRPHF